MRIYIEIESSTPFKEGDVVAEKCEVCLSSDGDRSSFTDHRRMVLRPIAQEAIVTSSLQLVAEKLRKMADKIEAASA